MTQVTVRREGDWITFVECKGHAGRAAAGENIVCSAVSVLMQTCVNALERVAGVTPAVTVDEDAALIAVSLPRAEGTSAHDAQVILRTTVTGLADIAQAYPKLVRLNQ